MRKPIRDQVVEMTLRGVSPKMILLAITRSQPATRLKLSAVKRVREEARRAECQ